MRTFTAPHTELTVPSVVLGMMRIRDMSNADIRGLVGAALDAGVNVFDHADIYGGAATHVCESRFGEAMKLSAEQRSRIMIQSKAGICPREWTNTGPIDLHYDFSKEHILKQVDGSLNALRTDYLDVFLLHRPDTLVEPDEVAAAFDELERSGKVRYFGVSNHTPGQIELLRASVKQPLVFNQMQLSIAHPNLIAQGIAANMGGLPQSAVRDNGLLDYSRLKGMTLQAWSPFQKGFFEGSFIDDRESYAELNDVLDELASAYGTTPMGIAVAWIVRHPANIQVVLGTTNPQRVAESAAASDIRLTREEWYWLFRAAGHFVP